MWSTGRGANPFLKNAEVDATPLAEATRIRDPGPPPVHPLAALKRSLAGVAPAQGISPTGTDTQGFKEIAAGHKLKADAADAFLKAQAELRQMGINIYPNSSYRDPAHQYRLYSKWVAGGKKGAPTARAGIVGKDPMPPGATVSADGKYWSRSLHSSGLAIDIGGYSPKTLPQIRQVMGKYGFRQFDPKVEPWHFSYGDRVG